MGDGRDRPPRGARGKTIVCACEDVTLDEVRRAWSKGHRDLESVKRYTGFGTGPCQGKSCVAAVSRELLRLGASAAAAAPFTARTPVHPTPLAAFASVDPASLPLDPGVPVPPSGPREPPPASGPLPPRAAVVIVGGGIMGLALAYELGRRGATDVLVLERGYLNAGASGRNGGGVRAQWSTPTLIRLARRSLELCEGFAVEMGVNVWMRRGGYLFLARSVPDVQRLQRNAQLHERFRMRTRVITPGEAASIVPDLDPGTFLAASWNPDDAVVFPWPFLWGYAVQAERLGVRVRTFTEVTGLERSGSRISTVVTNRGRVGCDTVVNACGAWSAEVARLAGVTLPNRPVRHEILVTEPIKAFLDPLVAVLGTGLYFSQSARGEVVGGMGDPTEPPGLQEGSTLRFLSRFARAMGETAPRLAGLQVVRQWAGCYDVTPDHQPILGAAGPENFLQMSGFVGHGFMMAPAVAELMADWMTGRGKDEIFDRFTVDRFTRGELVKEDFLIG